MAEPPTRTHPPGGGVNETHPYAGAADLDPPPAPPGDRYELSAPIARGGMGEVFAARDLVLNREVAVKVLRADLRDRPAITARFLEEARITGQLQHPNIPAVHDLGPLPDGRPFLAMKLVKGRTLAALLAHARPDTPALLAVFEQVCQAVAFAHERLVIHRDLKPGNVMVGKFSEVQVMDWGLAKVLGEPGPPPAAPAAGEAAPVSVIQTDREGSSLTQAGSLLGTPAYMPPEQAKGEIDRTDARADVFALGAILCELLTGKPAYVAATAAEVQALALTAQLGPAFERLDGCGADPELVALAKRCLSPKTEDRPADGGEVAREIAAHRAGVAERLRAAELGRARAEERRKRARVQLALAAAVGVLLAGGVAFAWYSDRQATERRADRDREEARRTADRETEDARTREAVTAALDAAEKALRADDLPATGEALARARERLGDAGPDDLRGRYADLERDRDMVEALETLADGRVGRGPLAPVPGADRSYQELFRRYGLDLAAGDPAEMAARVSRSPIRSQLVAGLDATFKEEADDCPALLPVLKRVDGDPARTAVREAIAAGDNDRLVALVHDLDPSHLTPGFAVLVNYQDIPTLLCRRILLAVWGRHPEHFRLNQALAYTYLEVEATPEELAAGMAHARILVALRPASPIAYSTLASVLEEGKRYDEAIDAHRKVLELDPRKTWHRESIARLIGKRSGIDAEVAHLRGEVARTPDDAEVHYLLGYALVRRGEWNDAAASYRRAIERDPTRAKYHSALATTLEATGHPDEAVAAARVALQRDKSTFFTLVTILMGQERWREALGILESAVNDFSGADEYTRHTATYLAVQAGTLGGIDPYPPAERPAIRRKAMTWLREDLTGLRREVASGSAQGREESRRRMTEWLTYPALARVRHPLFVILLPTEEAKEWLAFWAEVRTFRDEVARPAAPPPREVKRP